MIEKLFGETPEEQYQYLKPRLMATAISLVLLLLGGVLYLLGLAFGEVLAGAGSILFAVVMVLLRRGGEVRSLQDLAAIYGVEPTGLFRLLFRPAVP